MEESKSKQNTLQTSYLLMRLAVFVYAYQGLSLTRVSNVQQITVDHSMRHFHILLFSIYLFKRCLAQLRLLHIQNENGKNILINDIYEDQQCCI